jgi:hypothetical protein
MDTSDKRLGNHALWQERIQAQASSGKTVAQFCRDTAIALSVFYAWKSRLNHSKDAPRVRPVTAKSFIDLGSVKLRGAPSKVLSDSALSIRLDLGSGISLSITRI